MSIITVQSQQNPDQTNRYRTAGIGKCVLGAIAGVTVGQFAAYPFQKITQSSYTKMLDRAKISNSEVDEVRIASEAVLQNEKLAEKGVKIIRAKKENVPLIEDILQKQIDSGITKFYPNWAKKNAKKQLSESLQLGRNSFYIPKGNAVCIPEKDLSISVFHELGHSHNYQFGKIGKILQKARGLRFAATILAIIALKPPKAPEQPQKGIFDKSTDFIKKHIFGLVLLTNAPILIEEAMATWKGNNFAKKVLNENLYKQSKKINRLAYLTYLIPSLSTAVGIWLTAKISDKITKPKKLKLKTTQKDS